MMTEYRVKLVRGSYGTRSWTYVDVCANTEREAVKKARSECGKCASDWKPVWVKSAESLELQY